MLIAVIALTSPGAAHATNGFQPGDGEVTNNNPTFEVEIDSTDLYYTTLWVASDTSRDSTNRPFHDVGSCSSFQFQSAGTASYYSCRPTYTSSSGSAQTLPPGTYYWWLSYERIDYSKPSSTWYQISGPFSFVVPAAAASSDAYLVSPADGASLTTPVRFTINAPAGATMEIYAALSPHRDVDNSPLGLTLYRCSGSATSTGQYYCTDSSSSDFLPGVTYYWWAVITVSGSEWVYGPRSFTVSEPPPVITPPVVTPPPVITPPIGGGGGGGSSGPHQLADANELPRSAHFSGRSVKQTRLSDASYALTKRAGDPTTLSVACWSKADWPGISGDSGDTLYSTYGLFFPAMPHWIHLSPATCKAMETLLYHRPRFPNRILAFAVDTVTHEMIHALGIRNEARTECYAMQSSVVMALQLHVPYAYAVQLARMNLDNYFGHPAQYIDTTRCREGGAWDLIPNEPSLPWHTPA